MEYALEVVDVSKKYEGFALEQVNIKLPRGYIMGFIGENGAGKTTTIKLILDLIKRDAGRISVLGKDNLTELNQVKEHLGVVMEDSYFPDNLTAVNVNSICKNIYKTWDEAKYEALRKQFSLPGGKIIKEYSKGMKMKLSIAAALSHGTKLLILDEATSGLDPIVREEILDVFLEFIQDEKNSVLMSSHIISDLEKACDYITFIHQGKILFSRSKDELLTDYGVLKCSEEEFTGIDDSAVKGYRKNSFGVEALVLKDKIRGRVTIDRASIEDIMLYHIKGAKRQ